MADLYETGKANLSPDIPDINPDRKAYLVYCSDGPDGKPTEYKRRLTSFIKPNQESADTTQTL